MNLWLRVGLFAFCVQVSLQVEVVIGKRLPTDPASSGHSYVSKGPVSYMHFSRGNVDLPIPYNQFKIYHPITIRKIQSAVSPVEQPEKTAVNTHHQEKAGESHQDSYRSSEGQKGEKGYRDSEEYSKGSQGQYAKEVHSAHSDENGGNKQNSHDGGQHYESHDQSGDGHHGGEFAEKAGHRKGSKITGYHKVIRKDEYKKDHTFYDKADKEGSFEKYGNGHREHSSQSGHHEEGSKSADGHHEQEKGKEGFYDKGREAKEDSGYKSQEGNSRYHQQHSDYGHEDGAEEEESFEEKDD